MRASARTQFESGGCAAGTLLLVTKVGCVCATVHIQMKIIAKRYKTKAVTQ
jgi:hypothetical protein